MISLMVKTLYIVCFAHVLVSFAQHSIYSSSRERKMPRSKRIFCLSDVDCNASYSCFPLRTGGKRPHLGICRTKYALPVLRLDVVSVRQCDCPIGTTCTEMLTDRSTKAKDKVKLFLISFLLSIDRGGLLCSLCG